MAAPQEEVRYARRNVDDWLRRAYEGRVAITDFQRSFVWDAGRAAAYVEAILRDKPVGLYLILATSEPPQFQPRSFSNINTPLDDVHELVLDGQQRLTSLLQGLYGHPVRRFYIEVRDLSAKSLELVEVGWENKNTAKGKRLDEPGLAYRDNRIPLDIVRKHDPSSEELSPLDTWCSTVRDKVEAMKGTDDRLLQQRIRSFVDERLFGRDLWFCGLPSTTGRAEATDIFVDTNTSSVKINRFDIEVASARGHHNENIRETIQDAYEDHAVLRHYFPEDPEDWIPGIGEWMLKVACLHANHPPKDSHYGDALKYLFPSGNEGGVRLNDVILDMDWALRQVEGLGAATRRTLPSWPPVHVMAALRTKYVAIKDPAKVDFARRLLEAYYWRCLFSSRHEVHANERLFDDFRELRKALDDLTGGMPKLSAFDEEDHRAYDADQLLKRTNWIGSGGRLGRGLVSAVMSSSTIPRDWMTGEVLNASKIRELEGSRNLDRHHVFPRDYLKKGGVNPELIRNGLNGVLLDRRTNLKMWKDAPARYWPMMLEELNVEEKEVRKRIEGHVIPFEEMTTGSGTIKRQYDKFLRARARLFAEKIEALAGRPG